MKELEDRKSLKAWLKRRPRSDVYQIVGRDALRIFPLIGQAVSPDVSSWRYKILLPCFRAAQIVYYAAAFPSQITDAIEKAADKASDKADHASDQLEVLGDSAQAATLAADSVADAATGPAVLNSDYIGVAMDAIRAAAEAAKIASHSQAVSMAPINQDIATLESGSPEKRLIERPLWDDTEHMPRWIKSPWEEIRKSVSGAPSSESWNSWIEWYEALLSGTVPDFVREQAIALIKPKIWDAGPEIANVEVARLIGSRVIRPQQGGAVEKIDLQPETPEPEQQSLAADRTTIQRGVSVLLPPSDHGSTIAFFSYTRADDERTRGLFSKIRQELEDAIALHHGSQLGVFQDTSDIEGGDIWRQKLEQALADAAIFVPMITPTFFNSPHCREELTRFLARDSSRNTIIPIHFFNVGTSSDDARDALRDHVQEHQWLDWRPHNRRRTVTQTLRNEIHDVAELILERWRSIVE